MITKALGWLLLLIIIVFVAGALAGARVMERSVADEEEE